MRRRLTAGDPADFSTISQARDEGATDILLLVHRFAAEGVIGEMDCVYSAWSSDAADGFGENAVAALKRLAPFLKLAVKSAALARMAGTLAETYIGRDAGRRVMSGRIVRGVAEKIGAVLWYSDLHGYTQISDNAPPEQIIEFFFLCLQGIAYFDHLILGLCQLCFYFQAARSQYRFLGEIFEHHSVGLLVSRDRDLCSIQRALGLRHGVIGLLHIRDDGLAVSLILCSGQFHLEFRATDAAASPYLALGAVIFAGVDGLRRGLKLPTSGPPEHLPQSLPEALDRLAADETVAGWFGPTHFDAYIRFKRAEAEKVAGLSPAELCARYAEVY